MQTHRGEGGSAWLHAGSERRSCLLSSEGLFIYTPCFLTSHVVLIVCSGSGTKGEERVSGGRRGSGRWMSDQWQ